MATCEEGGPMLALHMSLATSLYQSRRQHNLCSCIIVTASALVVCSFCVYSCLVWQVSSLVLLVGLGWNLPTALFLLGVAKQVPFLLLPWISIAGLLVIAIEFILISCAIMAASDDLLAGLLLLLVCLPLPLLLTLPVKSFVYMEANTLDADTIRFAGFSSWEDQPHCSALHKFFKKNCFLLRNFLSRKRRTRQRARRLGTNQESAAITSQGVEQPRPQDSRPLLQGVEEEEGEIARAPYPGPENEPAQTHGLYPEELTGAQAEVVRNQVDPDEDELIRLRMESLAEPDDVDEVRIATGLGELPPSYSLAEGLDQLPAYSQLRLNRVRLGRYVFVYDHSLARLESFRK